MGPAPIQTDVSHRKDSNETASDCAWRRCRARGRSGARRGRRRSRRADLQAAGRPQRHRLHLREVRLRLQAALGGRAELYRGDQGPRRRSVGDQGHDAGLGRVRADRGRPAPRKRSRDVTSAPRRTWRSVPAPARTCWSAAGTSRSRFSRSAPRGSSEAAPPSTSRNSSFTDRPAPGCPSAGTPARQPWREAQHEVPPIRAIGAGVRRHGPVRSRSLRPGSGRVRASRCRRPSARSRRPARCRRSSC